MTPVDRTLGAGVPEPSLATWLEGLRPSLHRYCARMTGSVIDGEDVVQETLLKAIESFPGFGALDFPQAWLFRVAHNASMDLLRARAREAPVAEENTMADVADPASPIEDRLAARTALGSFMRLAPAQRSSVILMDVLGYTLDEICTITGRSLLAVKAALHRGRTRLRQIADEPPEHSLPSLSARERELLATYVAHFNARDFTAVRDLLADEVRLDLVARTGLHGKAAVGTYLHNYSQAHDWLLLPGLVEDRPAALVCSPRTRSPPAYFVLLAWNAGQVTGIRDFRYARYVMDGADVRF